MRYPLAGSLAFDVRESGELEARFGVRPMGRIWRGILLLVGVVAVILLLFTILAILGAVFGAGRAVA